MLKKEGKDVRKRMNCTNNSVGGINKEFNENVRNEGNIWRMRGRRNIKKKILIWEIQKWGDEKKGCENGRHRNGNKERTFGRKMTVVGVKWEGRSEKNMKM